MEQDNRQRHAVVVSAADLSPLNPRPSMGDYLRQLWERRDFILLDAQSKAFRSTRKYRLWRFWLIADPLLNAAMYGLLFGALLRTSRGIDNFVGFIVIGITFFGFLTSQVSASSGLISNSQAMIRAFAFPRASLVISKGLQNALDSIVPAIVAVVAGIIAGLLQGVPGSFSWTAALVAPLFLLLHLFALGLMFFVARLTAFLPDIKALVNLGTRAWMFSSGVFYSIDRFATHPMLHQIMTANPGYLFLTAIRDVAIYNTVPGVGEWLVLIAWAFVPLVLGFIFFWRAEDRYVRVA